MSNLLIHDYPLLVSPKLAARIGLEEAVFLQQLHWLCEKSRNVRDGEKWVYNTYEGWVEQFPFWGWQKIGRIVRKLEAQGLVVVSDAYNRLGAMDKTKWYRVNYASELLVFADCSDLKDGCSDLKDEFSNLKDGCSDLKDEFSNLKDGCSDLKDEFSNLKEQLPETFNTDFPKDYHTDLTHRPTDDAHGACASACAEAADHLPEDFADPVPVAASAAAVRLGAEQGAEQGAELPKAETPKDAQAQLRGLVGEQLAADYMAVRKDRGAKTLTHTALAGLQREAAKAGLPLADAVRLCIERGWASLRADWLLRDALPNHAPNTGRATPSVHTVGVFTPDMRGGLAKDILP